MKLDIEKLPLTSMDIKEEQITKLKQLFPEAFTEGNKIDWDRLKLTLGEDVDAGKERYGMNWPGKSDCFKTIQQPSIATLVPVREESVNFDTTENLFIEGDNLEVLKLLQKSYIGKIKMIYIDPPYNTGNEFIYPDNYSESLDTYLEYTGQIDGEGRKFSTNTDTDGRFHSKWMSMMYPRLFLAKNLLKEDGVIFISIDDNEVQNLRALCNEIFGEQNFIDILKWKRKKQPSFLATHTAKMMEYVLIFSKDKLSLEKLSIDGTSDSTKKVINVSNKECKRIFKEGVRVKLNGSGVIPKGRYKIRTMEVEYLSDVNFKNGKTINNVEVVSKFSVSQQSIDEYIKNDLLFITSQKGLRRDVSIEEIGKRKSITDLLLSEWGDNQESENELIQIFNTSEYFEYNKPLKLLKNLIKCNFSDEQIVLDFFAGSCSTAQAVIEQNKDDGGSRNFICVQLPETLGKGSLAEKSGYKTIADIGKERIRRVIKKLNEEESQNAESRQNTPRLFETSESKISNSQDLGFKVFKLQKSNFNIWNANIEKTQDAIREQLALHLEHISPEAEQESILYELLLKSGFSLTAKIEKFQIEDYQVFSILDGALLICLEKKLTHELIKAIAERKPVRVICLDEGFQNDDQLKANAVLIMKSNEVLKFQTV